MKKLTLRTEHLAELTPLRLRGIVAGLPADETNSCTCVSVICNVDLIDIDGGPTTANCHVDISICCRNDG